MFGWLKKLLLGDSKYIRWQVTCRNVEKGGEVQFLELYLPEGVDPEQECLERGIDAIYVSEMEQ